MIILYAEILLITEQNFCRWHWTKLGNGKCGSS